MVGLLAPTDRRECPQRTLQVQLTQIAWDNRRAIVDRGADKGVLVYLRANRRKLHRHGHSHSPPYTSTDVPLQTLRRGSWQGVTRPSGLKDLPGMRATSSLRWAAFKLSNK